MVRRRSPIRRSGKKLPPWALVLLGLALGLAGAWLLHLYSGKIFKGGPSRPSTELSGAKPSQTSADKPKPRFDFYTILPEIESVLPEKEPKKARAATVKSEEEVRYALQAASLANFNDADQLKAKLALAGLEARIEKVTIEGRGDFYRVRLGPYAKLEDLEAATKQLDQLGIKALRLKLKKTPGAG
jgi:cell division protein FtsN